MVAEELIKGSLRDSSDPFKVGCAAHGVAWFERVWTGFTLSVKDTSRRQQHRLWRFCFCWRSEDDRAHQERMLGSSPTSDAGYWSLGTSRGFLKRHGSSNAPGPWTGSILQTGLDGVFLMGAQDKWDKAKAQVKEVIILWFIQTQIIWIESGWNKCEVPPLCHPDLLRHDPIHYQINI